MSGWDPGSPRRPECWMLASCTNEGPACEKECIAWRDLYDGRLLTRTRRTKGFWGDMMWLAAKGTASKTMSRIARGTRSHMSWERVMQLLLPALCSDGEARYCWQPAVGYTVARGFLFWLSVAFVVSIYATTKKMRCEHTDTETNSLNTQSHRCPQ